MQSLVGDVIDVVTYHEIDYFDGQYHFFDDPRFDSLDFGLGLQLSSGKEVSLTWGNEFYQYGVSLCEGFLSGPRVKDVSDSLRWAEIIGKELREVKVSRDWVSDSSHREARIDYPQDVLLVFEGNIRRLISAIEIRDGEVVHVMMDHITVFDDMKVAECFYETGQAEQVVPPKSGRAGK